MAQRVSDSVVPRIYSDQWSTNPRTEQLGRGALGSWESCSGRSKGAPFSWSSKFRGEGGGQWGRVSPQNLKRRWSIVWAINEEATWSSQVTPASKRTQDKRSNLFTVSVVF